jgi:membrane fusion protein, multidrug efflux system
VTSPISGIAGQQLVTAGALVGSGTSDTGASGTLLTTVQQVDPVYVNFTISAADLITLRQAQGNGAVDLAQQNSTTVQVDLPNGTPYDRTGTLDFSDPAVNATTGTVNLRALVANPQHLLLPGMYVTLTARFGQQNNVFLVPQQALLRDTEGPYLLVVEKDSKVARKDIDTNASLGTDWIVTKGLADGDQVIVTGALIAHEGMEVTTSPWQPPAPPMAAASGASGSQPSSAAQ